MLDWVTSEFWDPNWTSWLNWLHLDWCLANRNCQNQPESVQISIKLVLSTGFAHFYNIILKYGVHVPDPKIVGTKLWWSWWYFYRIMFLYSSFWFNQNLVWLTDHNGRSTHLSFCAFLRTLITITTIQAYPIYLASLQFYSCNLFILYFFAAWLCGQIG